MPTVRPADAGPADADDAVCLGALCPQYAQLTLMMLSVGRFVPTVRPAEADDADAVCWTLCAYSTPS